MNEKDLELLKYREMMYRLLAGIFIEEIDRPMLDKLMALEFPKVEGEESWVQDLSAGFEMMKEALSDFAGKSEAEKDMLLEDLAADYAKTFLAAGDAAGKAAFPYESVYTGTDSQFGGSVQMNLNAEYAAKGLSMKEDMFRIFEDHVGLEFNFMAELLKEQQEALAAGDQKKADKLSKEQKKFFKRHIVNWVMLFAADIYKYSEKVFYRSVARITIGFVEFEQSIIQG
ncbi:MAG: molecular chaperone TorD family protein [Parasporobacterium sp.]|nr:molecular chaperone TorD family protein [Parasporobacterium sp.]